MRLVAAIVQKVDPTDRADRSQQAQVSGLPPSKGDGRLRASFSARATAEDGILFVELLPAELVRHCDDQIKNGVIRLELSQGSGFSAFYRFPVVAIAFPGMIKSNTLVPCCVGEEKRNVCCL